jgi:hypothetical protein
MVWALSRRGVQLLVVTIVLSLGFVWVGSWTTTTSYEFRDSFVNTVPGPVTGPLPVPVTIDANTYHVSWEAPVSEALGSPITNYVVYAFTCDGDYTLQHAYTGSGQTSIDFGPATESRGRTLDTGISYKFTVRSYNRLGWDATTHDTATATPCSDGPMRSESEDESGTPAIVAKPASKDWSGPLHLSTLGSGTSTLVIDASFIVERLVPGMPLFQTAPLDQGIRAEFTESGRLVAIFQRPDASRFEIPLLDGVVPGRLYRIVVALDESSRLRVNVGGQETKTLTIGQVWVSLSDPRPGQALFWISADSPEFEGWIDQFGVFLEVNSPIVDGNMRLLGQLLLVLLATTGVVVMTRQLAERRMREPRPEGR